MARQLLPERKYGSRDGRQHTDNPGCDVAGMNRSAKAVSDAAIYFECNLNF
jgi:hypothetical protein